MLESKSIHVSKMRYSSYMSVKASQITDISGVCSTAIFFLTTTKHQSSALLAHFWRNLPTCRSSLQRVEKGRKAYPAVHIMTSLNRSTAHCAYIFGRGIVTSSCLLAAVILHPSRSPQNSTTRKGTSRDRQLPPDTWSWWEMGKKARKRRKKTTRAGSPRWVSGDLWSGAPRKTYPILS